MADMTADQIGRVAESLAAMAFALPVAARGGRPLFRPTALGDKYPTLDLLVDLLDPDDRSVGFCFVQVKGTETPPGPAGRLPVRVDPDDYNRMVTVPAPTYLVGVDVLRRETYLVAAHRPRPAGVSSVTTAFRLADEQVKIGLYEEVLAVWQANRFDPQHSRFSDD